MAKTLEQKKTTAVNLEQGMKTAKGVVFANFQGLTVAKTEQLRKNCRQQGITMNVAKKTLVKRVLSGLGVESSDPKNFAGGIATFIAAGDEVAAAKTVYDFSKANEVVAIFGGLLNGSFIDAGKVQELAKLPSKQQLLGQLVGTINAPVSGFVNVLAGNLRNLVGVLSNIKDAKQA